MRNFTTEQLDLRAQVILNAFKVARQTARDAIRAG
jgi:hypothetical protein